MLYWVVKAVLGPFLRLLWRPWIEGLDRVPEGGAAILASNHLSFLDSIFIPLVVPRRVTFLAKSDYFTGPGVKGWFKRLFFSGTGQVPIDRSGGAASDSALRTGVKVLQRGKLLGIYPEGTRSPDGRLYRGKIGVARMALESKVLVIPVAVIGTFEVQPQGKRLPKIRRVGIRIGRPIDFSRYDGTADDRFVLRSMTDQIMYEIMSLSGQEYVDMYAQRAKLQIAAARESAPGPVDGPVGRSAGGTDGASEHGRGGGEPATDADHAGAQTPPG